MTFEEWWKKTPPGHQRRPAAAWSAALAEAERVCREESGELMPLHGGHWRAMGACECATAIAALRSGVKR